MDFLILLVIVAILYVLQKPSIIQKAISDIRKTIAKQIAEDVLGVQPMDMEQAGAIFNKGNWTSCNVINLDEDEEYEPVCKTFRLMYVKK